ncbi:MAG: AAA family ATPase [Bacteroidota bacterium]
MSKEKLIVKNFGPIKDVEIELEKVNVFIGEQAGGKSTLAKLVAIFRDWEVFEGKIGMHGLFERLNIKNFMIDSTEITYEGEAYRIRCVSGVSYVDGSTAFEKKVIRRETLRTRMRNFLAHMDQAIPRDVTKEYTRLSNEIKSSKYIPAERMLISLLSNSLFSMLDNEVALPRFLIQFGNTYQLAKLNLSNTNFSKFGIRYELSESNDFVTYNSRRFPLKESSSGIQALLPLILVSSYFSNATPDAIHSYIVEEPELNLYPTTQKILTEYLVEQCAKNGNNLILTTHSPYILTVLSNLIQASNVIQANPELKEDVIKLIPEKYHLAFEDVRAYYIENGTARSIMDAEYRTVDANPIDDVSEEIGEVFDKLLNLKYQK